VNSPARSLFPRWRWVALAWLLVYLPSYSLTYGAANFLFLCNIAVVLTCVGLWRGSALLLSSQALSSLLVDVVWALDFLSRLLSGRHLIGGTEYMFDARWPLFTRLLSLYHLALPGLFLAWLRRTGYDRRAYLLQSLIALLAVCAGRLAGRERNINFAFVDPFLKRSFEPAGLHVAVIVGGLVLIVYPLTASVLSRFYAPPAERDDRPAPGSSMHASYGPS
jgi:hypothetical protein